MNDEPWNRPARKLTRNEVVQRDDFWTHPRIAMRVPMYSSVGQKLGVVRRQYEKGTEFWTRRPKA